MSCDLNLSPWTICYSHSYDSYHGVIYGWDHQCEKCQGWIMCMGVNELPLGPYQPFYNVLVDDGSDRYEAQGKKIRDQFCKSTSCWNDTV